MASSIPLRREVMTILVYADPSNPQWKSTEVVMKEMNIDHQRLDMAALKHEPTMPEDMIPLAKAHQPVIVADDEHWWGHFPNRLRAVAAKHQKRV